jgi:hypothetical protein
VVKRHKGGTVDTLLSKLTDLAYEFFGVILPGFFFLLFLILWWLSVAPMLHAMTGGTVPDLTLSRIGWLEAGLSATRRTECGILLVVVCYFLGQMLNWFTKGGGLAPVRTAAKWMIRRWPRMRGPADRAKEIPWRMALFLQFPRPGEFHHKHLSDLKDEASKRLSMNGKYLEWGQFYPVAKALIAEKFGVSLIQTYQHKYTLHRCSAAAATVLFWFCVAAIAVGLLPKSGPGPNWLLLLALACGAFVMVRGFAGSYTYFWKLWGDTVVTEAYALLCVPRIEGAFGRND